MSRRLTVTAALGVLSLASATVSYGQSASAIYTWDNTGNPAPNVEGWVRNFGAANTSATLDNNTFGVLTITETSAAVGGSQAFTDGANRIRESSTAAGGGTDLTGLDWLEFDLGHNGPGPINVQFFVQASTGFTFVGLGPDLSISPGMNTYQVPLSGLTPAQQVYVRTMGFNARDHAAVGNVTWSLGEVRAGGTPLTVRDLITHDAGTAEGGIQGAIANFDLAAIQGNNGGQNQSGLTWNSAGSGSLQWTDLGGGPGAAMSWGNGTAWNGNTFNNRDTDLSNYLTVTYRISATDPSGGGGTLGMTSFFQTNNFQFQGAEGSVVKSIPIDGQFYDVTFSLAGLANMNVVDLTGLNLQSHPQNLIINVDNIRFAVPEPASVATLGVMAALGLTRRTRRVA